MNTEFLYFKGSKKIAYGCSQLMNAKEFVEQVGNIIVIAIMVLYQGVIVIMVLYQGVIAIMVLYQGVIDCK